MLLDIIKLALRITSDAFDGEILELIDSAKADLHLSGVSNVKIGHASYDSLLKRAIILYAKAHFGLDNKDSEKYQKAYDSLKIHLALSAEYTEERVSYVERGN